jgi:putative ABC transport system substrate-binding protein
VIGRIGYLQVADTGDGLRQEFSQGLGALGYVEGQNVVVEWRNAKGRVDQLPTLAAELVTIPVDIIVAPSQPSTEAARNATRTIPIVFTASPDPVGEGLVASVARPGGNLTGLLPVDPLEINPKRLQLFKEAVPNISRVAILYAQTGQQRAIATALELAAQSLDVEVLPVGVSEPYDLDAAFATAVGRGADSLYVLHSNPLNLRRTAIVSFGLERRWPTAYAVREWITGGGLMGYWPSGGMLKAAAYVDRILKGANPAELPLEGPSKFELLMNLTTAEKLGVKVPQSVAILVTEWIR